MTFYKNNINFINPHYGYPPHQQFQEEEISQFPNINNKRNKISSFNTSHKISINVADTQYEIVLDVCQNVLKWKLIFDKDNRNWDVCWTDHAVSVDMLLKMEQHQKINHFPGMSHLSRKNLLAKNLQRMQDKFAEQYDYFPKTWLLPHDYNKLRQYSQQLRKYGYVKTFIVKPEASSQGRGIYLTKNIYQIQSHQHCIVQKYVTNPLLYKGLKFDLRIYVLLAGCDPLRIYLYNEGLVRLATQQYEKPNADNIDNMYMHLTNYAINKDHPNFIFNETEENLNYGHKRSMAQFFQTLKKIGVDSVQIWADIKDNIIKTIISGQPHLAHQYRISQPHNLQNNMCFEILGFDFMINQQNKVYLLEINYTPSFSCQSPLDQLIKSNLIRDSLVLMNINKKNRQKALIKARQIQQKRVFTGKTIKIDKTQRNKLVAKYQNQRDNYQDQNLGSYEKIYPSFNQQLQKKYQVLLKYSEQTYSNSNASYNRTTNLTNISKYPLKKIILKRQHTNISIQSNEKNPERAYQKSTSIYNSPALNKKSDQFTTKYGSRSNIKLTHDHEVNNHIKFNKQQSLPKVHEKTIISQIREQVLQKSLLNPEKSKILKHTYQNYDESINVINHFLSAPFQTNNKQNDQQDQQDQTVFSKYMQKN